MRVNFPFINNIQVVKSTNNSNRSYLKPLPYDTFEKISFTAAQQIGTSTHSFDIKNIKNLRCPVCGLIMLTDDQIDDFVDDIKDKRGFELYDALKKYENENYITDTKVDNPKSIFRPQKQEIVNIIKDLAIKYPKKSLSELVDLEAQRCIDILIEGQMKVVSELEQFVKNSNIVKFKKDEIKTMLDEYKKQIYGTSDTRFSRKSFIHDFSNIILDTKNRSKINEIVAKMPTSQRDINSWFVKYSKSLKSADIALKLVQQSIPTAEHLVPKSKDGANSLKNYICDCSECNSSRSNLEFDIWMETIPNFKENLQQYLQDIQNAIDSGKISRKNNSYIVNIIDTISKLSNSKIILDVPNSTDGGKRERMLVARENEIEKISKHIKEQSKLKKEKEQEIEELESHPYYQNLFLLETLERNLEACKEEMKNCKDNDKLLQLKEEIKTTNNKMNTVREYIEKASYIEEEISTLQKTIYDMERTQSQLSKLKEQIYKESELREKQTKILIENVALNTQNSAIIQSPGFDIKDKHDYEYYFHLKDLLKSANYMLANFNKTNKESSKEITQIAIDAIKDKLSDYLKMNSVQYFINTNSIQKGKTDIESLNKSLDEIESKKANVELFEKDLFYLGKGKTIDQLKDELEELFKNKEIIARIHELPQYRSELKNLSDTISFNKKIYHDLKKHYETMTSEEFTYQTNLIY